MAGLGYAFIDARSLLENFMRPLGDENPIEPVPCQLEEEWVEFEKTLDKFKRKFSLAKTDANIKVHLLHEKREELNVLRMMLENVTSQSLKGSLQEVVDKYEAEEGIDALSQQCGEALGKVEAMKKVMMDTGAERYAKFTCFVCMDRLVDLFIDPCGHVMCERCWAATRDKSTCPGCRQHVHSARKKIGRAHV